MLHGLYYLIIYPIELLLGIVFNLFESLLDDPGLAIIGVSIAVNLLMLPLYQRADRISEAERRQQEKMEPFVRHIKSVFKGDEGFMMMQAYYRTTGYRPLYALRSSLPLLLEIPFFIAAYHFLSHLSTLNGRMFMWIKDLGQPDSMIVIPGIGLNIYTEQHIMQDVTVMGSAGGSTTYPGMVLLPAIIINILPILMTLINIISVLIYTKGSPLKEKIQLYVMAGLFLVLLYKSPSGLVVYWTMNNIFSLVKNIVMKCRKSDKTLISSSTKKNKEYGLSLHILTLLGAVLLVVLTGILIPSSVIVSSPSEFVMPMAYQDPVQYIISTAVIAAGFMLIWLPVFYYLASDKVRLIICGLLWVGSGIALIDFLAFGKIDAFVSSELRYSTELVFSTSKIILNTIVLLIAVAVMLVIFIKKRNWIRPVYYVLIIALILLSGINIVNTEKKLKSEMQSIETNAGPYEGFTISKRGKNVVVIMLDRAIGPYVPYIMNERPELMDKFSGFTYYPNTISFGGCTILGGPALFGGYEYTPVAIDERKEEKLVEKHNEALKLMPVVFSENGYRATVYDPPYASYNEISDLSIYDEYPDISAYSIKQRFIDPEFVTFMEKYRKRSMFMYSIFKTVPVICQTFVYDDGEYLYPDELTYPNMSFCNSLSVLQNLTGLTDIEDTDQNTFMMMDNETPHDPNELQLPDYTISGSVNNRNLEPGYRTDEEGNSFELDFWKHYHANMAAFIQLGKWLDYLKENGVYDNTRIIIVSDHGYTLKQFEDLILDDETDVQAYIPLLMYKDFDAKEYSVDDTFMTNADTPVFAMKGIIENPVNPFTGNVIDDNEKRAHDQSVICTDEFDPDKEMTVFEQPGQVWYTVHDNAYDKANWKKIDRDENGLKE